MRTRTPSKIHVFCEKCGERLIRREVELSWGYDPHTGLPKNKPPTIFTECPNYRAGELEVGHDHFVDNTNMGGMFDYEDEDE